MTYWKVVLKDGTVLGDKNCNCIKWRLYVVELGYQDEKGKSKTSLFGKIKYEPTFDMRFCCHVEDVKYAEKMGE